MRSLTARAVLVTCLAALVSVLVTALVALPFASRTADQAVRRGLADKAQIAADFIATRPREAGQQQLTRELRGQNIEIYLVRNGAVVGQVRLPARIVDPLAAGQAVHGQTAMINGHLVLVEAQPLANSPGNGVVLTQRAITGIGAVTVLQWLWLALLAGLLAGLVAGAFLAARLARPIRNAAGAAVRLSAGDRTVRLTPEPPTEVEELAHALNGLATALATSEGRQRDFLLSISHELRTPLTTIRGYAEALADGVVAPDGAVRTGQTVLAEAERLDRLVSDLLALARLDAVDFPLSVLPVDLVELTGDVFDAWSPRCQAAGVVLRIERPPAPVVVPTDPGRIRQVIDVLMDNAVRVLPPGTPVTLGVYPGPDAATVEVRDGGPGFSDADLSVIFERGAMSQRYQGERKIGSGLGLALADGLVRRLGGTITAGHAPEGGARFSVRLPARPSGPAPVGSVYQARTSY